MFRVCEQGLLTGGIYHAGLSLAGKEDYEYENGILDGGSSASRFLFYGSMSFLLPPLMFDCGP